MNCLNQVIFEGEVESLKVEESNGVKVASMVIASTRVNRINGETVTSVTRIKTLCSGLMAEVAENNAKVGRGLRVVGRLEGQESLYVLAEHMDYKPMKEV